MLQCIKFHLSGFIVVTFENFPRKELYFNSIFFYNGSVCWSEGKKGNQIQSSLDCKFSLIPGYLSKGFMNL